MNGAEQNHTFAERHLKSGEVGKGLAFEAPSRRHKDINGYLHVEISPLTKETVNPYRGREIPGWDILGLDPEKIYNGYRAGSELQKALNTFNGIPVLDEHKLDSAERPLKEERIGYTGTSAKWESPYIMNALIITDSKAIELIESNKQRELSASYRYKPVFESGSFNGEKYDFIMTEIQANHIALVAEGRAGSDVLVYDSLGGTLKENNKLERRTFTQVRSDTLPKGEGGKGENGISPFQTKGEKKMAKNVEELKKAFETLNSAFQGFLDEEKNEPAHAADSDDNYKDAMEKAGCDSENEVEQKAFAEGVKYGEELIRNNAERKKLDSEHESKGMKKAEAASDKAIITKAAFDSAIKQAEERGSARAVEHMKSLYNAAADVKKTVSVNPLAYDSASDIYKEALKREGADFAGVDKSAYQSLYKSIIKNKTAQHYGTPVTAMDSKEENSAFKKNIKVFK